MNGGTPVGQVAAVVVAGLVLLRTTGDAALVLALALLCLVLGLVVLGRRALRGAWLTAGVGCLLVIGIAIMRLMHG